MTLRETITETLHCETLRDVAALNNVRGDLARIAETPAAASGMVQHPDWLLGEAAARGPAVSPYVVIARESSGRIVGYAPFLAEQHLGRIAFAGRQIPLYRGPAVRMLGSTVVAPADQRAAAEQAISTAIARDANVRVIRIQETVLPNTLAAALSQGRSGFTCVPANLLEQTNWTIQPQASLQAYLGGLGSKRRNDLERRLRKVYKNLGQQAHLRVFEAPADIDEYCRLMNQAYARSWHAAALPIDWEQTERRASLHTFAQENHFIGHLLMLGERPIAYVHGYRLAGRYLLDDTGYDEEFAPLGVGSALVFQVVQGLIGERPGELIDFGYGDNQYKRVLADRQVPCGSLYLVRGAMPRLCFGMISPLRRLYRSVRWLHQRAHSKTAKGASK